MSEVQTERDASSHGSRSSLIDVEVSDLQVADPALRPPRFAEAGGYVVPVARPKAAGGVYQWQAILAAYPWPLEKARDIVDCESDGDPEAVDPTRENFGLWAVNEATWRPFFGEELWAQVFDPVVNTQMAWIIFQRAGNTWTP